MLNERHEVKVDDEAMKTQVQNARGGARCSIKTLGIFPQVFSEEGVSYLKFYVKECESF